MKSNIIITDGKLTSKLTNNYFKELFPNYVKIVDDKLKSSYQNTRIDFTKAESDEQITSTMILRIHTTKLVSKV